QHDQMIRRDWMTLIPTPNFPAYVSGHSTFSATSAQVLKRIIGTDRVRFSGKAPDLINWPTQLAGVTRSWTSLSHAAEEGGHSREYGGIHWESDDTEGMSMGKRIGDHVVRTMLRRA
ncbi:MAG: vanadium-dependent haloperoxidase, partial [Pseudomonadota bacterium]